MTETLYLDLDNFLFKSKRKEIEYIKRKYRIQIEITAENYMTSHYDLVIDQLGEGFISFTEFWVDLSKNYFESEEWQHNLEPMPGMIEVLTELAKRYQLIVVTARPKESLLVIKSLLSKHLGDIISYIHCVWELKNGKYESVSKVDFIQNDNGIKSGFIDDSPNEVRAMKGVLPAFLFDPTQMHRNVTDIENHVSSFEEIYDIFK